MLFCLCIYALCLSIYVLCLCIYALSLSVYALCLSIYALCLSIYALCLSIYALCLCIYALSLSAVPKLDIDVGMVTNSLSLQSVSPLLSVGVMQYVSVCVCVMLCFYKVCLYFVSMLCV